MSFGTFTLFNFLQQPNTGEFPVNGSDSETAESITQGSGVSGAVFDGNWVFPYAGTLVPYEVVLGGGAAFSIKLSSDLFFDNVPNASGLRYVTIQQVFSGDFCGDVDRPTMSSNYSGNFFAKDSDYSSSYLVFSGLVSGAKAEVFPAFLVVSGDIISATPDFNYASLGYSGSVINDAPDRPPIRLIVSGDTIAGTPDHSNISVRFSGRFIPVKSDSCTINYSFLSFSSFLNNIVSGFTIDDSATINYGLSSFISTRAIG